MCISLFMLLVICSFIGFLEKKMDEIIYVTSLGSLDIYPRNNVCAFTNELVTPITLDSNKEYEMGILSLLCPKRISLIMKGDEQSAMELIFHTPSITKRVAFTPQKNLLSTDMETTIKVLNKYVLEFILQFLNLYKALHLIPQKHEIFEWDGTNVSIKTININKKKLNN